MIPQSFIDELIARCDIVEVVSSRVGLKKAGREYQACCPFHDEKTPSFTVSPTKQFYHCFGCGAHGNVVGFVMEYDRLGFVDAVEELAQTVGLTVPKESGARRDDGLDDVYAALAEAETIYRQALKSSPEAVKYLKDRGIDGQIARDFAMGYAPDAWDTVVRWAGGRSDRMKALEKAGLVSPRSNGGFYDKFRGRIMFPIHDTRGRPIAFGGRVLSGDDGPKYLNSPETPVFHKGRQLYGLYQARQAVKKLSRLLVVEGYMDVVALAQFGLPECVATLGTATTADHAETLFRAAPEVVFCFDGDRAGRQAAYRALDSVLPRLRDGRQARFLFLPDGEDPDTLIRDRGREEFEDRLRAATPLSEVFFARHQAEVDLNSLDGRARFVELCRPQLATIPDGAFRDMMYERMAELARSPAAGRAPPAAAATIREEAPAPRPPPGQRGRPTLVRQAIILLLNHPKLGGSAAPVEELVEDLRPGIPLLVELFQWCRDNPQAVTATVLGHWQGRRDHDVLGKLAQMQLPLDEDANVEAEFTGAVTRLVGEFRKLEIEAELAEFQSRISESGLSSLTAEEKDRYRKLLDLSENVTKRQ